MRFSPLAFVTLIIVSPVLAQARDREASSDRMPVIAKSGDVEVATIRIVRWSASDAAIGADLTNMEIELWFTSRAEGQRDRAFVKITELSPIEDNTGKLLSTKKRLGSMPVAGGEVRSDASRITRGKEGPLVRLLLDAPARQAETIRSIKGKAVVSRSAVAHLEFKDLPSISGKQLDHAKLKDFAIEPTIVAKGGETVLTLRVPVKHARLLAWDLVTDGRPLPLLSEAKSTDHGDTILEKTYEGNYTVASSLQIVIAQPSEPRTFEFDFKNVALP